jgi:hypothetical protein
VVAFSIIISVLVGWRRGSEGDAPLGFFSEAPFQVLSPAGTLFAYLPWMILWKSNVLIAAGIWGVNNLCAFLFIFVLNKKCTVAEACSSHCRSCAEHLHSSFLLPSHLPDGSCVAAFCSG